MSNSTLVALAADESTSGAQNALAIAVRRYFTARDAFAHIDGPNWLNLKGAARQAVWRKRRAELDAAEVALRELVREPAGNHYALQPALSVPNKM